MCRYDHYFSLRRHSQLASYHGYLKARHAGRRNCKGLGTGASGAMNEAG